MAFLLGPRTRIMTVAGLGLVTALLLPSAVIAGEDDGQSGSQSDPGDASLESEKARPAGPYPYVLAIINGGVVTNVAALSAERDYSGLWASLRASNDAVLRVPVGTAGIGWVILPDGSLGPEPPPVPPEALPRQPESTSSGTAGSEWTRTGDPERTPGRTKQYPYVLAIINGGVVTNVAALSAERDYSGLWASLRASNDAVLRVPVGTAGIGWMVMADGSLAPPKPRAGLVWNGEEWRPPGAESVQRPSDVRGWMTGRSEPVDRSFGVDQDDADMGNDAWMYGLVVVPDDALEGGPTRQQLAERSIIVLESSGRTIPFLARFDGFHSLLTGVDDALEAAIRTQEDVSGEPVLDPERQGFRTAVQRVIDPFLRLFGIGTSAWIRLPV